MDVVFREAPAPESDEPHFDLPVPVKDNTNVASGESNKEPIELREEGGKSVVLDCLNINENLSSLPEGDRQNVHAVKRYVMEVMDSRGLAPTVSAFQKTLDSIKGEMGLDQEAEPSIILERIAGVVHAWHSLSFITDATEKKKIFMTLANMKSSSDMNKEVYRQMELRKVWR